MRLIVKIFIGLFLIIVAGNKLLAQSLKSNFEVQIYGIPYYKLANHFYENKMITKSAYFDFDYSERINQEFGINIKYKKNKWKLGVGFSHNNFNYDHGLYFVDFNTTHSLGQFSFYSHNELKLKTIGLGLLVEREILKSLNLGVRLSLNSIYSNEIINTPNEFLDVRSIGFIVRENHYHLSTRIMFIPEIYISKRVYKRFDFLIGYKLKFWKNNLEPDIMYEVDVRGPSSNPFPTFNYSINPYQAGLYFGASYTFKLPKLRKPKTD